MSCFSSIFCCFNKSQQTFPKPDKTKGLEKVLPNDPGMLGKINDQSMPLIFCYGNLSPLLHMQRLPMDPLMKAESRIIKRIACGEGHFVAQLGCGKLLGCGSNEFGQLGFQFKGENAIPEIQSLTRINLIGINLFVAKEDQNRGSTFSFALPLTEIVDISAGANHTIILVKNHETNRSEIFAFGNEVALLDESSQHSHIPSPIVIDKVKENDHIERIQAKNNTSLAVYKSGRVYMWGENTFNMRLRKPKAFFHFKYGLKQIDLGKRHGIALDKQGSVYVWGDGTYGELGIQGQQQFPVEKPLVHPYFSDKVIRQVAAGARHSLALDEDGKIYVMGDNSEDQCAISGRRANAPQEILKEFFAEKIFVGDAHNVAVSAPENKLYSWGGSVINQSWVQQSHTESKLRLMEDLKDRKIAGLNLSYSNTIIITGQDYPIN